MTAMQPLPSVPSAAYRAWVDGFQAIDQMRGLALTVFLIEILRSGIAQSALRPGFGGPLVPVILTIVLTVLRPVLLAPFAIGVHRFVLLGEVTPDYRLDPGDRRFRRFSFYGVLLMLLGLMPGLMSPFVALLLSVFGVSPLLSALVAVLVVIIAVVMISIRAVILFPAVAVDARWPSWRRAAADTKGHSWYVFFVLLVAALPLVALMGLALGLIGPTTLIALSLGGLHFGGAGFLLASGRAVATLIVTTVLIAAASRLYRALGASLG